MFQADIPQIVWPLFVIFLTIIYLVLFQRHKMVSQQVTDGLRQARDSAEQARQLSERANQDFAVINQGLEISNQTLTRINRELEASNKELDAFASTVAHNLKSPIALISGYSEMLARDRDCLSAEQVCEFSEHILRTSFKMTHIIDELMLLSSVRQISEIELRPLEMGTIVHEVKERLRPMVHEYQAELIIPKSWPNALGTARGSKKCG